MPSMSPIISPALLPDAPRQVQASKRRSFVGLKTISWPCSPGRKGIAIVVASRLPGRVAGHCTRFPAADRVDSPVARGRRRYRAVRARTRAARAGGALDRAARGRRPAFSAGYGHPVRPRLLPRDTSCADLERASHRLEGGDRIRKLEDHVMNESALGSSARASRRLQFDQFSGTNDAHYATCSLMMLPPGHTSGSGR
jgi:hypothetical protein